MWAPVAASAGAGERGKVGTAGQWANQVRAGGVAFRVAGNGDKEVVGTLGGQRSICSGDETEEMGRWY